MGKNQIKSGQQQFICCTNEHKREQTVCGHTGDVQRTARGPLSICWWSCTNGPACQTSRQLPAIRKTKEPAEPKGAAHAIATTEKELFGVIDTLPTARAPMMATTATIVLMMVVIVLLLLLPMMMMKIMTIRSEKFNSPENCSVPMAVLLLPPFSFFLSTSPFTESLQLL